MGRKNRISITRGPTQHKMADEKTTCGLLLDTFWYLIPLRLFYLIIRRDIGLMIKQNRRRDIKYQKCPTTSHTLSSRRPFYVVSGYKKVCVRFRASLRQTSRADKLDAGLSRLSLLKTCWSPGRRLGVRQHRSNGIWATCLVHMRVHSPDCWVLTMLQIWNETPNGRESNLYPLNHQGLGFVSRQNCQCRQLVEASRLAGKQARQLLLQKREREHTHPASISFKVSCGCCCCCWFYCWTSSRYRAVSPTAAT